MRLTIRWALPAWIKVSTLLIVTAGPSTGGPAGGKRRSAGACGLLKGGGLYAVVGPASAVATPRAPWGFALGLHRHEDRRELLGREVLLGMEPLRPWVALR